jgi:hypothetical protein
VGVDAYIMEMDFFTNEDRGCFSPVVGLDVRLAKGLVLRGGAGKCSYTKDRSWPFGRSNELPRSRAARYHRYAKSSNNFSCPRYICL